MLFIKRITILLPIFFCVFFAFGANAQVRNTDIALSLAPIYPSLNQNVNVTINSYTTDLNKAFISWLVNGKESISGVGKKSFSFNTENMTQITVEAHIETPDGQSVVKTVSINPAEIDMLWEAPDSYAPPFYKGKKFVSQEGTFKVVAMPNIFSQSKQVKHIPMRNVSFFDCRKPQSIQIPRF